MAKMVTVNPQMRYILSEKEYNDLIALANANEVEINKRVANLWEAQSAHDLNITLRILQGWSEDIVGEAQIYRVSLYAYKDDNSARSESRKLVASEIKALITDWYSTTYGDVAKLHKAANRKMFRAKLLWRTYWIAGIVGLLTALILKFV